MGLPNTFLGIDTRPGPVPDSAVRRLDETTPVPFEPLTGGVPLDALAARLEVAVTATAGTQLALSDLLNIAKGLSAALSEVRDTNEELMRELAQVGEALSVHARERVMLEARVEWLSSAMVQAQEEGAREQARLIAEHDHFIAMLMADHDRELEAMRMSAGVAEVPEPPRSQPPELPRMQPPELPRMQPPELPRMHPPELPRTQPPELPRVQPPELPRTQPPELPRAEARELPRPVIPRLPRRQP